MRESSFTFRRRPRVYRVVEEAQAPSPFSRFFLFFLLMRERYRSASGRGEWQDESPHPLLLRPHSLAPCINPPPEQANPGAVISSWNARTRHRRRCRRGFSLSRLARTQPSRAIRLWSCPVIGPERKTTKNRPVVGPLGALWVVGISRTRNGRGSVADDRQGFPFFRLFWRQNAEDSP